MAAWQPLEIGVETGPEPGFLAPDFRKLGKLPDYDAVFHKKNANFTWPVERTESRELPILRQILSSIIVTFYDYHEQTRRAAFRGFHLP
jgi:hypothetical protein